MGGGGRGGGATTMGVVEGIVFVAFGMLYEVRRFEGRRGERGGGRGIGGSQATV